MKQKCRASNATLAVLYCSGKTLQEIGDKFRISRQRVQQRLKRIGITRNNGGQAFRSLKRRAAKLNAVDRRHIRKFGCTRAEYLNILKSSKTASGMRPTHAYSQQRANARVRGIPWRVTLAQWWSIWLASGKWHQRGRGLGYVMCRFGDSGAYEVGNLYIAGMGDNVRDSQTRRTGIAYRHVGKTFVPPATI